ncbi:histone H1-like [Narcine bancroftii]|uniref:histone H1-like n=1 Tax=Narcine bancroftii TaxID=1343680 RepID=UPI003831E9B8
MTETAAAEAAPPATPGAQTKAPKKKKAAARPKPAGPKLGDQIDKIVADCRERGGMSYFAIKKALSAGGVDVRKSASHIKTSIKRKLDSGLLVQCKGSGLSGHFKAGKKERTVTLAKKAKKPAATASKSRKSVAKKSSAKRPVIKKSPSKKPAAKKSPSKKHGAKKPAAKKTAAKKPVAKKATPKKLKSPPKAKVTKVKATKKVVKSRARPKSKPKAAAKK